MKISFIGFGNMARAMAQHFIKIPNHQIYAASPSLSIETTQEGIHIEQDNLAIIPNSDLIILAVKPDKAMAVLKQIGSAFPPDSLLISIVSGLTLQDLAIYCHTNQAIVRAMPNLPIAIGKGATPLIANPYVSTAQKKETQLLFEYAGMSTWLTNESDMDSMTALSGSGPAYLFYFMEAMINAAKKLGLSEEIAKTFTLQTLSGAIELAKHSGIEPQTLRTQVTSKGGTTAAALEVLQDHFFEELIFDAIQAAQKRSQQIGMLNNKRED